MKLKYILRKRYKLPKKYRMPSTSKATYALLIQFLYKHNLFEDYLWNLYTQGRISSIYTKDMEEYLIEIMEYRDPGQIFNLSLNWEECTFPQDIHRENMHTFWHGMNEEFNDLYNKFVKEVINGGEAV